MEKLHVLDFAGTVEMLVAAAAKQMDIPLAGEAGLQAGFALILDKIAYHQFFATGGHEERFVNQHGLGRQRALPPNASSALKSYGDTQAILANSGLVRLLNEITSLFVTG